MGEDEIDIPIYLITGFLESGKTTFINFTVAQEYFQIDEPTLLITTEEGEVEYDEKELLKYNTVLEVVENQEQFTPDYLKKLKRRYSPERVILEYNPLWSVKSLEEMEMPRGWGIVQEIVTVDASCFQIYMQNLNLKSIFMEMVQHADMVMFIYRPDYYGLNATEDMVEGEAQLLIEKHRSGSTGMVKLRFVKEFARFENIGIPESGDIPASSYGQLPPNTSFDTQNGTSVVTFSSSINNDIPEDNGEPNFMLRPPRYRW